MPPMISKIWSGNTPGSPPGGARANSRPLRLIKGPDWVNAAFKSPQLPANLLLAASWSTICRFCVLTVGAYFSTSNRSGSRSQRMQSLLLKLGVSPTCSPGLSRRTMRVCRTLSCFPWALRSSTTRRDSSTDRSFMQPLATILAHSSPSATAQASRSSGRISRSSTSSLATRLLRKISSASTA